MPAYRRKAPQNKETFWVTNISNRLVSLADLGLSIQPRCSVNLLDSNHYQLTKEQLLASSTTGSLFAKQKMITIRVVPPYDKAKINLPVNSDGLFISKHRSMVIPEEAHYEELNITDDQFAEEHADTAEADHAGKWHK